MSSRVEVTEDDFAALAWAANAAYQAGKHDTAHRLDIMARKANASLAYASVFKMAIPGMNISRQHWRQVPTTIISAPTFAGKEGAK